MISITDSAQKYFTKLLSNQQPGTNIRIFINLNKSNSQCELSYCSENDISDTDIKVQFHDFCIYVDKHSSIYLQDTKIYLINNTYGAEEIIIKIPTIKTNTLNDKSSLSEQIMHVLESQINPNLANHGGYVTLVEVTTDMIAILQFSGGCNGCSMVQYTLQEGIEKELLKQFPVLKGVKDFTQHYHGEHSYY